MDGRIFRANRRVALPLLCLLISEMVDASMFIAAFVAGLAVQVRFQEAGKRSVDFAEEWGQVFNLSVFFLFGMAVVRDGSQLRPTTWLYAILSLTVVRMLPVAIALMGTRLSRASVLFMGWFGPRGLASIVLGMVYMEQEVNLPGETTIKFAVMATVLLSIFAHGLSATPGISLYARKVASLGDAAPELRNSHGEKAIPPAAVCSAERSAGWTEPTAGPYFGLVVVAVFFGGALETFEAALGCASSVTCCATLSDSIANVAVTALTSNWVASAARGKSLSSGSGLPTLYKVISVKA